MIWEIMETENRGRRDRDRKVDVSKTGEIMTLDGELIFVPGEI